MYQRFVYNKIYIFKYNIYCRMIVYNIDIKTVYDVNTKSPWQSLFVKTQHRFKSTFRLYIMGTCLVLLFYIKLTAAQDILYWHVPSLKCSFFCRNSAYFFFVFKSRASKKSWFFFKTTIKTFYGVGRSIYLPV